MPRQDDFRRKNGVTRMQYGALCRHENGVITFARAHGNGNLQQMHLLVKQGMLEYVSSPTDDPFGGSWRLTSRARALMEILPCPHDHTPNATTVAAFEELDAGGGTLYEGTAEEAFAKILAEEDDEQHRYERP